MDHRAEQLPSGDRLVQRIIDRYGQSPGLISMSAILRQAARLHRFGVGRLPLLTSVQRRYAPARTYLSGNSAEFRYAWPFTTARALAPGSAIMPSVGQEKSSAPITTAPPPPGREGHLAGRTSVGERRTVSVQRQPVNPTDRPIRRVVRQAEPKVLMPIIQTARQSASGSTKVGAERSRVDLGSAMGQGPIATNRDQIVPQLRPASMASQSVPKVSLTASTSSQTGSIGPQPGLKGPSQLLPTMKIPTNPLSPNGERIRVRGRQNSLQSNSLEQFIGLSPPHCASRAWFTN